MEKGESWADGVFEIVSNSIDKEIIPKKKHIPEKITAYHEAGHAVIDLYHRIPPDSATIIPNEKENTAGSITPGYLKYCDVEGYYFEDGDVEEDEQFNGLLVLLSETFSGMLASFIYTGELNIAGLDKDLRDVGDAILSYNQELTDEMVNAVTNYTLTVLMKNWEELFETVAEDLIIHKTLDKQYFQDFYKSASFIRIDPVVFGED